jgi:hypothetical protein
LGGLKKPKINTMSWSITFIGKPDSIAEALQKNSDSLNGQSKLEFDSALPHLTALVKENFGPSVPLIKISASGHGTATDGVQTQRHLSVSIEPIYGVLV